ncbi:MAG: hypothetical protein HY364_00325 [Candidatus Aenigmarchaeota archaeon]|nr:hypothetical protein [Candidatus Aenigmarchaeota archaeon]
MKGITAVIAVILLLLITVAITGFSFTFLGRTQNVLENETREAAEVEITKTQESFRVVSTQGNKIYIRNTGPHDLQNLEFFVDGSPAEVTSNCPEGIKPQTVCIFEIAAEEGEHEIIILGNAQEQDITMNVVSESTTTITTSTTMTTSTTTMPLPEKFVFVTSATGTGKLSTWSDSGGETGISAADKICDNLAEAVSGLTGKNWVAWLSSSSAHAKDRIRDAVYKMPDNAVIANTKADLLDGVILNPILVDENGAVISSVYNAWTGSDWNGNSVSSYTCNEWADDGSSSGMFGFAEETGTAWTYGSSSGIACTNVYRLYCFEV